MLIAMKASSTHQLLLTCTAPQQALQDFGDDVARGKILGTATVIYDETGLEGDNAKLKPYWRRIIHHAQEAAVWTEGRAKLLEGRDKPAVSLTNIQFDDDAVENFVMLRRPPKLKRGKRRIQDEWTPFWIAAAQLAKAGVLNVGEFPTQKDLIERLHTMMGATLDEQTIKPFVAKIYNDVAKPSLNELEKLVAESA